MSQLDLIIGPLYFLFILMIGAVVRLSVNTTIKKYFLPALMLKLVCSILLGVLYQYYYSGGDTYSYFTHGARHIWEAFQVSPETAFKLIFFENNYQHEVYEYASRIYFYRDDSSYFLIRICGLVSLFCFGSYAGTALLFACFSFSGGWILFKNISLLFPNQKFYFAAVILFYPSVAFWGSGILKDTITFGCVCWVVGLLISPQLLRNLRFPTLAAIVLFTLIIYMIKSYITFILIPAAIFLVYSSIVNVFQNKIARILVKPVAFFIFVMSAFALLLEVGEINQKYSFSQVSETAARTAYDIRYWSGKDAGSGYSLGDIDSSVAGMLSKFPSAINVTLFRPYLWEVNNFIMLLASIESIVVLVITIYSLFLLNRTIVSRLFHNNIFIFCLFFSLIFAFAVGVSTYNFGTLIRYKIPAMPFYLIMLGIIIEFRSVQGSQRREANP